MVDSTEVVVVVGDLAVAVVEEVDLVVTEAVEAEVSAEDEVVETEEAETGQSHMYPHVIMLCGKDLHKG